MSSAMREGGEALGGPADAPLVGAEMKEIAGALLHAFPVRGDLARMLRYELDRHFDHLVPEGDLNAAVFALLTRAEAEGWVGELVEAALRHVPGNPALQAIAARWVAASRGETRPPKSEEPPSGALPPPPDSPYDPRLYVRRRAEERRALSKLTRAGTPVVLWAPDLFGKRTMAGHLLAQVREEEQARGQELLILDADLATLVRGSPTADELFERFAIHLLTKVGARAEAFEALARPRPDWVTKLLELMADHVLPAARGGRVILVLKRADALWGSREVQGPFYQALRLWNEGAAGVWSRFRLILLLSATPSMAFDDPDHLDSPFTNLTNDVIELGDLSADQVVELASLHGLGWGREVVDRYLYPLVGGHPYLLRVIMHHARLTRAALGAILGDAEVMDLLFSTHLGQLGRVLEQDPVLQEALVRVLGTPGCVVEEDHYQRLRRAGVVARAGGVVRIRYALYEVYLRRRWQARLRGR